MDTLVSIVIPCRNEEKNIGKLLDWGIKQASQIHEPKFQYEAIVVDDSDDQTAMVAESHGAQIIKGKRQGLGQAIIDGINVAKGDIIVVMDGDGSHNPHAIPGLIRPILEQGADMVIGSRYVVGGDLGNWSLKRRLQSIIGVKIMQLVTGVKDSNSGFFTFRREVIEGVELKASSWKIMLEVLFKGNVTAKQELPIQFGERWAGVSKNSIGERTKHAKHLIGLLAYKMRRYISFAIVGGLGALWYFGLLYGLTEYGHLWYMLSAVIATVFAATHNYIVNHFVTFRKSKGENRSIFKGWTKYLVAVGIGDGTDLLLLLFLTEVFGIWYMLSALLSSFVASVIKYTVVKQWIWGTKGKSCEDADYEWYSFYKGKFYQKIWKRLIARKVRGLAMGSGKTLDIGCGSSPAGILTYHNDYTGIDVNEAKIKFMRNKIKSGARFDVGSVLALPYDKESFETVLFIETIEHLENWSEAHKALEEIHRVLQVDGQVIIATPNYGSWAGRIQDKLYGIFQKEAYADQHKVKFSPEALSNICLLHNLEMDNKVIPLNADMVCKFTKTK